MRNIRNYVIDCRHRFSWVLFHDITLFLDRQVANFKIRYKYILFSY